jgi:hypothetical protein
VTFSVALLLASAIARAQAPTLAGRWSASPLRADWNIGDWGPACGPKPGGGGTAGATLTISTSGNELNMSFPGRAFSTAECWEQFPGLTRVSHSAGARAWRNVCKTGPTDPRQATVVTTLTATDNQIQFDETGQYQFVIQSQNCTASVRRTRTLTLLQREGAPAEVTPPAVSSAVPAKKPAQAPRCKTTGLPERLEVRPSRKLMRPGESFEFRAVVVDAAGCLLPIAPTWSRLSGATLVQLSGKGKVTTLDTATEGEARLQAAVGDRSVAVVVEVVSHERYAALLQQGSFNAEGESSEAAVTRMESSSIGARTSVARDEAQGKRIAFVAVVGALALALGIVGLLVVVRGKRKPPKSTRTPRSAGSVRSAAPGRATNICPTCREEFPETAEFCAFDGNRLVAQAPGAPIGPTGGVCPVCGQGYDPGVTACPKHQEPLVPALIAAERRQAAVSQKICPVCGTQFPGDSQFCGKCGAALVPVN